MSEDWVVLPWLGARILQRDNSMEDLTPPDTVMVRQQLLKQRCAGRMFTPIGRGLGRSCSKASRPIKGAN